VNQNTSKQRSLHGSPDSGKYFRYIAEFVGFCDEDAKAVRETSLIVEKHLPAMIGAFYTQLLRYPPTRKFFLKKDGTIDQDYLQLRMHHQHNFWRRAASGVYDDEFASFVDYVGRAHTSRGADAHIYIPERYVIGMVGFVQNAISLALHSELHQVDSDLEGRAVSAWNLLAMVLLEMLSRAYGNERQAETYEALAPVQEDAVLMLALETYERDLGLARSVEVQEVVVAGVDEIPEGSRKIVQVDELSIGVFHQNGKWVALRNSCLHRGGPVCTGTLQEGILTCPWHGYTYELTSGILTLDRSTALETYPVEIREGEVRLRITRLKRDAVEIDLDGDRSAVDEIVAEMDDSHTTKITLASNEFRLADLPPGQIGLVTVGGEPVAVYNVAGAYYATHNECTHVGGPLNEGELEGNQVICPWHSSCFDVTDGKVTCGPATEPVRAYRVVADGEIGRVI
jgi:3-phenylpropionate/trans-cinnamate dioxygenase ferredoxin component